MDKKEVGLNEFGQPIGFDMQAWQACPRPALMRLNGRFCRLEPLTVEHTADLFDAFQAPGSDGMWTYMPYGPFETIEELEATVAWAVAQDDPLFYAIVAKDSDRAVGMASYMRIHEAVGVLEVGHIAFAPVLQKTAAATEAMYLMMRHVFDDLGYRRYEWKCDSLNAPSRAASMRFGFQFEGVFRQHLMYKGRNRDTAWFSLLDHEWPARKAAFEAWLAHENFTADGQQIRSLKELSEGL